MKELLLRLDEDAFDYLDHVSNVKETTRSHIIRKSLNMYFTYFKVKEGTVLDKLDRDTKSFYEQIERGKV